MSVMEPSTASQPSVSEPTHTDAGETFFKTPNAPPGRHFEQLTVPGLVGSGPVLPEWVRSLFRRARARLTLTGLNPY
jgi:hypothetical protein